MSNEINNLKDNISQNTTVSIENNENIINKFNNPNYKNQNKTHNENFDTNSDILNQMLNKSNFYDTKKNIEIDDISKLHDIIYTDPTNNSTRQRIDTKNIQISSIETNNDPDSNLFINNNNQQNQNKIIDYSKENLISVELNFDEIINSVLRLAKTNKEFKYIIILFISWFFLITFEFIYGYMETLPNVMSDSFFNLFKIFAFLITGVAIYSTRYFNFRIKLLSERFEIIAGLSNLIFLLTENTEEILHTSDEYGNSHEKSTISAFKYVNLIKIILDIICLTAFSEYLLHPILQIKIYIYKKYQEWIDISEISEFQLQENKNVIKIWNNHFENMNCLSVNIICDLIISLAFLVCFYLTENNHFEYVYFFISLFNLILVSVLVMFNIGSIVKLLMQGKSDLIELFDKKLQKEVSLFEGCIGIREVKFWMISNNNIKGN